MNHPPAAALRFVLLFLFFYSFFSLEKAFSQSCDNWLSLPTQGSKITIGDADVIGNKLTVEA